MGHQSSTGFRQRSVTFTAVGLLRFCKGKRAVKSSYFTCIPVHLSDNLHDRDYEKMTFNSCSVVFSFVM